MAVKVETIYAAPKPKSKTELVGEFLEQNKEMAYTPVEVFDAMKSASPDLNWNSQSVNVMLYDLVKSGRATKVKYDGRVHFYFGTAKSNGTVDAPVKRKRGRPRKVTTTPCADVPGLTEKRKRGRPKKVVAAPCADVPPGDAPKRKRGRPRKVVEAVAEPVAVPATETPAPEGV